MMNLYYSKLLQWLDGHYNVSLKEISGYHFIYIRSNEPPTSIEKQIILAANQLIKKNTLSYECVFVRQKNGQSVFRFRFLVPSEKMFCCGNGCINCTRQ
ncbi:hypothetical protein [Alkalicoccobacillus porphyridii]|uniref:Uncharacterized protein n=1 Tax=Alkalicoccobacillus porphyridii TaxID=2597270 RepID=A0A553ZXZ0_9BACI|nr:hypothetical protein [Alkalicoccobacillus porphyridii]TSB46304.1 hypothetical protein FN960_10860 [Alkalicoccobacillus porphyridii]